MKKKNRIISWELPVLVIIAFSSISQVNAQTYTIDASHSSVQIRVERFGVVDVVGRFKDVSGSINYNADNVSQTKAEATIKVGSYDANNEGGEAAVMGVFLEAEKYPEISFSSKGFAEREGQNYLIGDLNIHGVSNKIELPFEVKGPLLDLPTQKQSIAFNASITINRQDYGIAFDRKLPNGIKLVADEVKISLFILAIAE